MSPRLPALSAREVADQHFEQTINEMKRLAKVKPPTPPGRRAGRKRNEGDG